MIPLKIDINQYFLKIADLYLQGMNKQQQDGGVLALVDRSRPAGAVVGTVAVLGRIRSR